MTSNVCSGSSAVLTGHRDPSRSGHFASRIIIPEIAPRIASSKPVELSC